MRRHESIVERVARALYEDMAADADDPQAMQWWMLREAEKTMWLEQAEVAIDAMRRD